MGSFLRQLGMVVWSFLTGGLLGMFKAQNAQLKEQVQDADEIRKIDEGNRARTDTELDAKL